jgi:hypothetical protein
MIWKVSGEEAKKLFLFFIFLFGNFAETFSFGNDDKKIGCKFFYGFVC